MTFSIKFSLQISAKANVEAAHHEEAGDYREKE